MSKGGRASGERRERSSVRTDSDWFLSVTCVILSLLANSVENRLKYLNGNGPNDSQNSLPFFSFSRLSFTVNLPFESDSTSKSTLSKTAPLSRLPALHIDPGKVRKRVDWCRQFVYPQKPCPGITPMVPPPKKKSGNERTHTHTGIVHNKWLAFHFLFGFTLTRLGHLVDRHTQSTARRVST